MLINATEQNQVTTLAFSRKRNTTDPEDIAIQVKVCLIIYWRPLKVLKIYVVFLQNVGIIEENKTVESTTHASSDANDIDR